MAPLRSRRAPLRTVATEDGAPAVPRGGSVGRGTPPGAHGTQTVALRSLEGLGDACEGMAVVGSMRVACKDVFAGTEAIFCRPMPPRPDGRPRPGHVARAGRAVNSNQEGISNKGCSPFRQATRRPKCARICSRAGVAKW